MMLVILVLFSVVIVRDIMSGRPSDAMRKMSQGTTHYYDLTKKIRILTREHQIAHRKTLTRAQQLELVCTNRESDYYFSAKVDTAFKLIVNKLSGKNIMSYGYHYEDMVFCQNWDDKRNVLNWWPQ